STSYWPVIWPSPEPVALTLWCGASSLDLPVRPRRPEDAQLAPFAPAEGPPAMAQTVRHAHPYRRTIEHDIGSGACAVTAVKDDYDWHIDAIDLDCTTRTEERYTIQADDPLCAKTEVRSVHAMVRGDWRVRAETRSRLTSTRTEFLLFLDLDTYENDTRFFSRHWDLKIPRDGV